MTNDEPLKAGDTGLHTNIRSVIIADERRIVKSVSEIEWNPRESILISAHAEQMYSTGLLTPDCVYQVGSNQRAVVVPLEGVLNNQRFEEVETRGKFLHWLDQEAGQSTVMTDVNQVKREARNALYGKEIDETKLPDVIQKITAGKPATGIVARWLNAVPTMKNTVLSISERYGDAVAKSTALESFSFRFRTKGFRELDDTNFLVSGTGAGRTSFGERIGKRIDEFFPVNPANGVRVAPSSGVFIARAIMEAIRPK